MQGGGGKGVMLFGKSKVCMLMEDQIKMIFVDVVGCDEVKEEVVELVEYLCELSCFQKFGGKILKGVLMVGFLGIGKMLLVKVIVGEVKVLFFIIFGFDFVEMFVGVGVFCVCDMFEQVKKVVLCIIFIDEIDVVGCQCGVGLGGGYDECEQILNQMLVEMDGFEGNEGIIVIVVINCLDVFDLVLLCFGCFDCQVVVGLLDVCGCEQILKVYMCCVLLVFDIDVVIIVCGIFGFFGVDLVNLVNEVVLFVVCGNKCVVLMVEFEKVKDKIMMGVECCFMVMMEVQKELMVYYEVGYVIIGCLVLEYDLVYKVMIILCGCVLGVIFFLFEGDVISVSCQKLESQIFMLYGGCLVEEIIYGLEYVFIGVFNDIKVVINLVCNMVIQWGFFEKLGLLLYVEEEGEVFFGCSVVKVKYMFDEIVCIIDQEVKVLIECNYNCVCQFLIDNMDILYVMKDVFMKYEIIDVLQIDDLMVCCDVCLLVGWEELGVFNNFGDNGSLKVFCLVDELCMLNLGNIMLEQLGDK